MPFSRIIIYICLSFLAGIALNSLILAPQIFMLGFFVFGLAIVSIFWAKDKKIVIVGFCLLVFATGIYRHQMFERPRDNLDYYDKIQSVKLQSIQNFNDRGNFAKLFLTKDLKNELEKSLDASLSPPHSSILGALILGEKTVSGEDRLSWDLKQKLNKSGTRHITSISGMNVIILANMLIGLGLILGLWRGQAFYFALIFIILFIIMVGAPPSAVRAGIMGGIVLFAQKAGRLSQAHRLLIIAATLMLAFNPLLLKFDIGFQLSFLATLGIAKLYPYLSEKLSFMPKSLDIFEIKSTVAMTIPAIVFTAPILAYNFGQLSIVSIFTNILVVPILGLVLGIGFFAGIAGIIFQPLGQIFFWPVWLFLEYVYKIIDWSAKIPFAVMEIEVFPWYMSFLYFALLWWVIKYFNLRT